MKEMKVERSKSGRTVFSDISRQILVTGEAYLGGLVTVQV
jgi:hypothetical protein